MRKILSLSFAILLLAGCGQEKAPAAGPTEAPATAEVKPATSEAKPDDTAKPAEAPKDSEAKDK